MISCEHYDYIELACMHGYTLKLTLDSGTILLGKAMNTNRNEQSDECIKMKIDKMDVLIVLNSISTMEVLNNHAQFKFVNFK
ncbi:MAG: Rho-binding antiterminator [Paraglaciecola sp.]|uniref:Rho-binding antiterminator n=1 Tax=Paraglaciecola sp. TaxID=1920173 RepID=UPI003262DEB7